MAKSSPGQLCSAAGRRLHWRRCLNVRSILPFVCSMVVDVGSNPLFIALHLFCLRPSAQTCVHRTWTLMKKQAPLRFSTKQTAAVSGSCRPTLAASPTELLWFAELPTRDSSVTLLVCWSKKAALSRVQFAPLQSHTLPETNLWCNRGTGGRAVGTHLSPCCHFDSRQQCSQILTSRPPSCSFQVVA